MTIATPGSSATPTPQPGATPTATDVTPAVTPDPGAAGATPVETPAPAAVAPETPAATTPAQDPKVLTIPSASMKRIKDEAATRGRQEYAAELEAQAQAMGFASHAEMMAAAQQAKQTPPAPTAAQQQQQVEQQKAADAAAAATEQERRQNEERNKRHLDEKKRNNIKASRHRRELDRLKTERDQAEARGELKLAAQAAGVIDLDYAVTVLERAIKGMSPEELQTFDEKKYFSETMRATHPHLYAPKDLPVDTGPGASNNPAPGKAPAAGNAQPAGGRQAVDANKLSPTEFQNLLRSRGLGNPSHGGTLA